MNQILKKAVLGIIPILIILIVWQYLSTSGLISSVFLPPVSEILKTLYVSLTQRTNRYHIPENFLFTMERTFLGFFLSVIVSVPLGLIIGSSKKIYRLLEPTIEVFRPLPPVALIPVFILLLGINNLMFVLFVGFGCSWPILINTIDGVLSIEPAYFDVAKIFKMKKRKVFAQITFPASSPFIMSGLRVSILLALLLTVVIEMTSAYNGLGWSTIFAQQLSDVKMLYGEIFLIAMIGFSLNVLFVRVENHLMRWHKGLTRELEQTSA
jgi:ABC-type nitrate/sulfonate/bicarbonate transport system permease component